MAGRLFSFSAGCRPALTLPAVRQADVSSSDGQRPQPLRKFLYLAAAYNPISVL